MDRLYNVLPYHSDVFSRMRVVCHNESTNLASYGFTHSPVDHSFLLFLRERVCLFKFTGDSYCMYFLVKLEITLIIYVPESVFP